MIILNNLNRIKKKFILLIFFIKIIITEVNELLNHETFIKVLVILCKKVMSNRSLQPTLLNVLRKIEIKEIKHSYTKKIEVV